MNFSIEHDDGQKRINVSVNCLLTQDIRKEILLAVAGVLKISNLSKVLLDVREAIFDPAEPMLNALALVDYMRMVGIRPNVKFAFLYKDAERHRNYFAQVAQSVGFCIRYFKSIDDAVAWLNA